MKVSKEKSQLGWNNQDLPICVSFDHWLKSNRINCPLPNTEKVSRNNSYLFRLPYESKN